MIGRPNSYRPFPPDPDAVARFIADNDLATTMRRRGLVVPRWEPLLLVFAGAAAALAVVVVLLVVVGRVT